MAGSKDGFKCKFTVTKSTEAVISPTSSKAVLFKGVHQLQACSRNTAGHTCSFSIPSKACNSTWAVNNHR